MPVLDIQDAISLLEQREARKAAHLLEQVVAEMPAYATARVLLARSYEALEDWDLALAVWQEALQIVPNSPVVRQGLERSASRAGSRRRRELAEAEANAEAATEVPTSELRAQDVPPPTHLPPQPREAAEPQDEIEELHDVGDTGTPHYEDLDRLISELESARIVPRPDFESVPSPDLEDDIEDVVSETLARIYASQGQYDEAARVYELLAGQHPEEAEDYLQKASDMRSRASDGL